MNADENDRANMPATPVAPDEVLSAPGGVTAQGGDRAGVSDQPGGEETRGEQIEQPAKVMRIGSMVKQLLEEVRLAPLDDAGRGVCARSTSNRSVSWRKGSLRIFEQSSTAWRFRSTKRHRPKRSSVSLRLSWSDGSRGSSTGSKPPWSHSRWPRGAQLEEMRQRGLPPGADGQVARPGTYL